MEKLTTLEAEIVRSSLILQEKATLKHYDDAAKLGIVHIMSRKQIERMYTTLKNKIDKHLTRIEPKIKR